MSVHGEYNRALESVVERLRAWPDPEARAWAERLAATRCHPEAVTDLSAAARACLELVEKLETDPARAASTDDPARAQRWRDALAHLRAHCQVILGVSGEGRSR